MWTDCYRYANTDFCVARGIGPSECVCEKVSENEAAVGGDEDMAMEPLEPVESGGNLPEGVEVDNCRPDTLHCHDDVRRENVDQGEMGEERDCECLVPSYLSYDCNCQYAANIMERFRERFPELVKRIKKMRFCIPVVHIRDHKETCEYLYGSFYTEGGCHFHGEQAESIWAEFNQLGGRTRQMSPGHRHDVLNDHIGDWNWQKTASMGNEHTPCIDEKV